MRSWNLGRAQLLALLAGVAGCGGLASSGGGAAETRGGGPYGPSGTGSGAGSGTGTGAGGSSGAATTGAGGSGTIVDGTSGGNGGGGIQAGTLTAGTWDDNLNFDFYLGYLHVMEALQTPGLPLIPRAARLAIHVTDGSGAPLAGARVTVTGTAGKLLEAPTRSDGRLFFFPGVTGADTGEALQITATVGSSTGTATAIVGAAAVEVRVAGATAAPPAALDLALVIDTTGSMGDEIAYLEVEMESIARQVAQDFPGVAQRWALIVYRDDGDTYVVRSFDFTTSLPAFLANLSAQGADGGGDYPESPDKALAQMGTLSWGQGAPARVAFWVADAPHHLGREGTMVQDVLLAQRLGIHVYPVSASGTDDLLEYTMRTAAEVTGGRYLFLTNDSGVGGDHKEPTIPCYVVTALNKAMLRMIDIELTGDDVQPAAGDIVRTSGNPVNGRCTLGDGQQVSAL